MFKRNIRSLEEVQNYLSNIPDINCGGCGIAALAIKRWLKKNDKSCTGSHFCFLDHGSSRHIYNKTIKIKSPEKIVAPSHVGFSYKKNNLIDCRGTIENYQYDYKLTMSEKKLILCINNVGSWNNSFDRKKFIPKIAKRLGIDLSDIKLER